MDQDTEQSTTDKELRYLSQFVKSRESDFSNQETDLDSSQESLFSSDDEGRLIIDEKPDDTLDRLLAEAQEPDFIHEPECLIKLQRFIDDGTYKVIDITETDDKEYIECTSGQNCNKVKEEKINNQEIHQERPSPSETCKKCARKKRKVINKKRTTDQSYRCSIRRLKLLTCDRKINLRPRARVSLEEDNVLYMKTQENIYNLWKTQKELSERQKSVKDKSKINF